MNDLLCKQEVYVFPLEQVLEQAADAVDEEE